VEFDLGQIFAAFVPASARGGSEGQDNRYLQAIGRLMVHAVRWQAVSATGIKCALHFQANGTQHLCAEGAIAGCVVCARPVCLEHAMVSPSDGNVVCFACVGEAQQARGVGPGQQGQQSVPGNPSAEDERLRCLGVLGLDADATSVEISAAYKALAFAHHPDRAGTAAKKKAASRRMVKINEAYSWLVNNKKRAA
jgi:hypothetical protein